MEETWRDVPTFEGLYKISNLGNVLSVRRRKLLTFNIKNGYCVVGLCRKQSRKWFTVHRLVAVAFIPNPEGKPEVNHIDSNRSHNALINLEWVTKQENCLHGFRRKEYRNGRSKLTERDVISIRASTETNVKLAGIYRVTKTQISLIKTRKSWANI